MPRDRADIQRQPQHDFAAVNVTILPQQLIFIDAFFRSIEPAHKQNTNVTFGYIAVKRGDQFSLMQGAVFFNSGPLNTLHSHYRSDNIRAGNYPLSALDLDGRGLVDALLSGCIKTPHGDLLFTGNESGTYGAAYDPIPPRRIEKRNHDLIFSQSMEACRSCRISNLPLIGNCGRHQYPSRASKNWHSNTSWVCYVALLALRLLPSTLLRSTLVQRFALSLLGSGSFLCMELLGVRLHLATAFLVRGASRRDLWSLATRWNGHKSRNTNMEV